MPLERMAYELDAQYVAGGPIVDLIGRVRALTANDD